MRILRYLTREVLTHMVAVSFVLLVIIISGRFVKYLAEAAVGDLAANVLLPVMFYRMPGFLELIIWSNRYINQTTVVILSLILLLCILKEDDDDDANDGNDEIIAIGVR